MKKCYKTTYPSQNEILLRVVVIQLGLKIKFETTFSSFLKCIKEIHFKKLSFFFNTSQISLEGLLLIWGSTTWGVF